MTGSQKSEKPGQSCPGFIFAGVKDGLLYAEYDVVAGRRELVELLFSIGLDRPVRTGRQDHDCNLRQVASPVSTRFVPSNENSFVSFPETVVASFPSTG